MDEQDWKALARIASSQDGRRLLAILAKRREECRDKLERLPDTQQLNRVQGSAEAIKELQQNLNEAREVVNKRFSKD